MTDLLLETRVFTKSTSAITPSDYAFIGNTDYEPPNPLAPGVILYPIQGATRTGGFTKLVLELNVTVAALADFRLLAQVHKDSQPIILLSGSDWGTVAGILKHKVGALNTLAADGQGMAYVEIGPVYSIAFSAKGGGASIATNGTFTGNANSWSLSGAGLAYNSNNVTWSSASDGVLKQLLATLNWLEGYAYEIGFTISGYAAGSLSVGTNTTPDALTVDADGTYITAVFADAHADGLVFTGDGFEGTIDNVTIKPLSRATVRGALYR